MHVNLGLACRHLRKGVHGVCKSCRNRLCRGLSSIKFLRLFFPQVELFVDIWTSLVEAKECIFLEDRVSIKIKPIVSFSGSIYIFAILNSIVFNSKNVLNQTQIGPGMVNHCLKVVKSVKQNQDTSL